MTAAAASAWSDGVLHRFQPHPHALLGQHGAIAHGENRRVGGAGVFVDDDAVFDLQTGLVGEPVVGGTRRCRR